MRFATARRTGTCRRCELVIKSAIHEEVSYMAQIVLASGSPRRRELLERIGVTDFVVRVP